MQISFDQGYVKFESVDGKVKISLASAEGKTLRVNSVVLTKEQFGSLRESIEETVKNDS